MPVLAWALLALAATGAYVALYFVLVTYRVVPPSVRWVPPVCRMDEGTCARVVWTREARLLGLPNSVYGLAWYAVVLAAAVAWIATGDLPAKPLLLAGSVASVAMSAVLLWALLVRLRTRCPLCFVGQAANALILAVLLIA